MGLNILNTSIMGLDILNTSFKYKYYGSGHIVMFSSEHKMSSECLVIELVLDSATMVLYIDY
jgi:hypothetical protein